MKDLIVVDGAGGYIGGHVVRRLAGAGYRVRAVDLPKINLEHLAGQGVETASFDITKPATLSPVLTGAFAVVHCAAAFDLSLPYEVLERVNVHGTRNLITACLDVNVQRLIHFSTGGVYGVSKYSPVDEKHPTKPLDAYSVSKFHTEKVVLAADKKLRTTIFRPTAVYGPGGKYLAGVFFAMFCILAERKIHLPHFSGGPLQVWIHVDDVARAVEFTLHEERTMGRIFNLAETEVMDAGTFFSILCENFGVETSGEFRLPTSLFTLMAKVGWRMPSMISAAPLSWIITKEWGKIAARHNLVPDLRPQFTRDFYPFLNGDHVYSCKAFCDLGFVHEHPSFRKSFPDVVQWYRDRRWIP
jgi:nucleoside-diphosphate-sugar epimerase